MGIIITIIVYVVLGLISMQIIYDAATKEMTELIIEEGDDYNETLEYVRRKTNEAGQSKMTFGMLMSEIITNMLFWPVKCLLCLTRIKHRKIMEDIADDIDL